MAKSIHETVSEATEKLKTAGIIEPRLQATSLLMHTLGVDRTFVIAHPEHELSDRQSQKFGSLVTRRAGHEPLQYIVGHQEFFKLSFEVTPDVLIPRPETELVVEAALEVAERGQPESILDVGTGSGCIVISLLSELSNARGVATDISPSALGIASKNASRHNVSDRLTLISADSLSRLNEAEPFSIIVSNPPYIPAGDIKTLQPEVREYEPLAALVSGRDGLDHIRALLRETPQVLQSTGHFIFEIGFGQRETLEQLVDQTIWQLIEVRKDLQNIPRTVVLRKR